MYIVVGRAHGWDDKFVGTFKTWDAAQDWIDRWTSNQSNMFANFEWRITTIAAP